MAFLKFDFNTAFLAIFVFLLLLFIFKRPRNLPPGPRSIPILGCLPNLAYYGYHTGYTAEPYRLFRHMAKDFGNVFTLHLATKVTVILNDYVSVKEAFRNPKLNDRPTIYTTTETNRGVLMANGEIWTRQRRFTLSTFRDFGIGKSSFQDQISNETDYLIKEFTKFQSNPMDLHQILSTAVSNVTCSVIFGKRFEYSDDEFQELLHNLDQVVAASQSGGIIHFIPYVHYLFPKLRQTVTKTTERLKQFVNNIVKNHKLVFDSTDMKDYIDVFLNELQNSSIKDNVALSEDNLIQSVQHLFIAGSETTVTTLRWCFLYMIAYPEIQNRLQEELDSVVGRNRLPRLSDNLPYTQATLMEIQRIASIVPLGVLHNAAADTTLCGYFIPKGTLIIPNLWAVHHNPDTWNEPENFQPERFLDAEGNLASREEYVPFSIGRRSCLGENLAKMELFVFFTHLLHHFSFKKPEGSSPITFNSNLGSTNAPLPFKVVVTERQ